MRSSGRSLALRVKTRTGLLPWLFTRSPRASIRAANCGVSAPARCRVARMRALGAGIRSSPWYRSGFRCAPFGRRGLPAKFQNCDFFLTFACARRACRAIRVASARRVVRGRAGRWASTGLRIVRRGGQFEEQCPQVRVGDGLSRGAYALRRVWRRRAYGGGVPVGCRDWHHFGRDGSCG